MCERHPVLTQPRLRCFHWVCTGVEVPRPCQTQLSFSTYISMGSCYPECVVFLLGSRYSFVSSSRLTFSHSLIKQYLVRTTRVWSRASFLLVDPPSPSLTTENFRRPLQGSCLCIQNDNGHFLLYENVFRDHNSTLNFSITVRLLSDLYVRLSLLAVWISLHLETGCWRRR